MREKPVPKYHAAKPVKQRKRGHPKKGEERAKASSRLEQQLIMELGEILEALLKDSTVECKRNAKGHTQPWTGYKLHMDTADGGVPISCLVTYASLHDGRAAIPLARLTEQRVDSCYDLMDSDYDAKKIAAHRRASGCAAIFDQNRRKKKAADCREQKAQRNAGFTPAERVRCRERSTVERAFGRLTDEFGGRNIWIPGHEKVLCHLTFSAVVLTVDQTLRIVQ